MCDGCYSGGEVWRITVEEWSSVRRQYAQALILFCGSGEIYVSSAIDVRLLKLSKNSLLALDAIPATKQDILEDFRYEFICHIWRAALRWLASVVATEKLPGDEILSEEELRLEFWATQLNDGGKFVARVLTDSSLTGASHHANSFRARSRT